MSFVAGLYVMALACLLLAATNRSLGWFVGAVVFGFVATYAVRQFKKEEDTEREGVSIGFFGMAILVMIVVMLGLAWLQTSA